MGKCDWLSYGTVIVRPEKARTVDTVVTEAVAGLGSACRSWRGQMRRAGQLGTYRTSGTVMVIS
jgi:hypothetical protein